MMTQLLNLWGRPLFSSGHISGRYDDDMMNQIIKLLERKGFGINIKVNVLCEPDYIYNPYVRGWLKLHRIPATYGNAFLKCHYEGAVLMSPLNETLAEAIHSIIKESGLNRSIFLGTHAMFSGGDFFSEEGVPLTEMPITWSRQGADIGDCLTMSIDGPAYYMHTSECTERRPYICYKRRTNATKLNGCGTFDNKYSFNEHTGSCYKLHLRPKTWIRAHEICAAEGGYLVIPNKKEEVNIINEILLKEYFSLSNKNQSLIPIHIGIRDRGEDGTWITLHGGELYYIYDNPDEIGVSHCGSIFGTGMFYNISCSEKTLFICEKDPTKVRFEEPSSLLDAYL